MKKPARLDASQPVDNWDVSLWASPIRQARRVINELIEFVVDLDSRVKALEPYPLQFMPEPGSITKVKGPGQMLPSRAVWMTPYGPVDIPGFLYRHLAWDMALRLGGPEQIMERPANPEFWDYIDEETSRLQKEFEDGQG